MPKILEFLEKRPYAGHIMFWIGLFLIESLGTELDYEHVLQRMLHKAVLTIPKIIAAYTLVYYQIPNLLFKKKYVLFTISFVIVCYLVCVGARILVVYVVEEILRPKPFEQETISEIFADVGMLYRHYYLGAYLPAIILLILKLLKDGFDKKSALEKMEKEKISAELSFLKSQIHPHFLFNTLNNLYVLTLKKSDTAPETVLKLSEILDYMLYRCNDPYITIEQEIQLIQNYVALEHIRYGKKLSVDVSIEVDNFQAKITPLLLISIIENAFKHGVSGSSSNSIVSIKVSVENSQMHFEVFNSKPKITQKDLTKIKEGIGLKNTRKQLALVYKDKSSIEVVEDSSSYLVSLTIDLTQ